MSDIRRVAYWEYYLNMNTLSADLIVRDEQDLFEAWDDSRRLADDLGP